MSARSFFDTNVLVYTADHGAPAKQATALQLVEGALRQRSGVVSIQVLQEYFVAVTRKLRVPADVARQQVALFSRFEVVVPVVDDVLDAIDLHRLHQLSFWDALILQSARVGGCARLFSEDLGHASRLGGVEVVNPFTG